jgi:hypothetical protein
MNARESCITARLKSCGMLRPIIRKPSEGGNDEGSEPEDGEQYREYFFCFCSHDILLSVAKSNAKEFFS